MTFASRAATILAVTAVGLTLSLTGGNPAAASEAAAPSVTCGLYAIDKSLTRSQVMTRARSWLGVVHYSSNACNNNEFGTYRSDDAGYVSMAWGLAESRTLSIITRVTTPIDKPALAAGDGLFRPAHIALFVKWNSADRSSALVYDSGSGMGFVTRVWSAATLKGYSGVRYNHIR